MKSIFKSAMLGVLSATIISSAYAGVVCKAHNANGKVWYGKASTRSVASENAMHKCMRHSKHGKKCVVASCRTVGTRHHEVRESRYEELERIHERLDWQCTTMNSHSERFVAMGASYAQAAEHATRYCIAQSPNGTECRLLGCFDRARK